MGDSPGDPVAGREGTFLPSGKCTVSPHSTSSMGSVILSEATCNEPIYLRLMDINELSSHASHQCYNKTTLNETTSFQDVPYGLLTLIVLEVPVPLLYQTLHPSLSLPEPLP